MMRFVLGVLTGGVAFVLLAFAGIAFLSDPKAEGERIDVATRTCAEILAAEYRPKAGPLLIWIAGYHANAKQRSIVDLQALRTDIVRTLDYCQSHGAAKILAASVRFMGENATAPSADAIDLSELTCRSVLSAETPEEKIRVGQLIFWLAGRYARTARSTVLDEGDMFAQLYDAGHDCLGAPDQKLMPIAEKHLQPNMS